MIYKRKNNGNNTLITQLKINCCLVISTCMYYEKDEKVQY